MRKAILLYFKGLLMGAADIVPGVSGGTMALITGIYKELIESIDQLNFKQLLVLRKEGFVAFWQSVNGPFLLPLFLGIASGILFLSGGITYLLEHQPILLWSFFFGLILASIYTLINQFALKTTTHYALLFTGFMIAYGITQISPAGTSNNLLYLFFSSMIAIIAMILPGISGAFIFILLGVYEEVLATVKGAIAVLLDFDLVNFKTIYTKVIVIGLGIVVGLKLFSRLLTWLFNHRKEATISVLIGFMIGALPKIWPWKIEQKNGEQIIFTNTNPLQFEGDPQLGMAIALVVLGAAALILLERFALKNIKMLPTERSWSDAFLLVIKGMVMGMANKIPGVSGGIIALAAGFYEELIYSFSRIDLKAFKILFRQGFIAFYKHINASFLLLLFSGVGTQFF